MSVEKLKKNSLKIGIIGAGPAGSLAAYFLASAGHSVEILERKQEIERKVCGEYLCPKGVELLSKLGLLERLTAGFLPLKGMVLVSPNQDVIQSFFPCSTKEEKGLSLNRAIFDQRLVDLAKEAGAQVLLKKVVVGASFDQDKSQWAVRTEDEIFSYDLLLAADGRQSKVGHLLKHLKNINTDRVALHCYLPRKIEHGKRLGEMHILTNGSYCGLDPVSDDSVNFSIVCNSAFLKIYRPKEIINQAITTSTRLSAMFDPINEDTEIRIVTTLKNQNGFVAGNQLAYLGDAAGFIDPLTGEGIYNALLSATLLADELQKSSSTKEALANYKRTKKRLSFEKNLLNHFFQFLIKNPILIGLTVKFLKKSPERANHFIGIIGNIHTPLSGIIKMLKA